MLIHPLQMPEEADEHLLAGVFRVFTVAEQGQGRAEYLGLVPGHECLEGTLAARLGPRHECVGFVPGGRVHMPLRLHEAQVSTLRIQTAVSLPSSRPGIYKSILAPGPKR